jgi:hypothetical protein
VLEHKHALFLGERGDGYNFFVSTAAWVQSANGSAYHWLCIGNTLSTS